MPNVVHHHLQSLDPLRITRVLGMRKKPNIGLGNRQAALRNEPNKPGRMRKRAKYDRIGRRYLGIQYLDQMPHFVIKRHEIDDIFEHASFIDE